MGVAGLGALARRLSIPYPIVLVIGGAAVRLRARLPPVKLDPEVVLVVFLPPLLYSAAFFANLARHPRQPARRSRSPPSGWCWSRWPPWRWWRTSSSPGCRGPRRSRSARSSRRPIRWPARDHAPPGRAAPAGERRSRARDCSTTRPRWSPTRWRSRRSWPAASRSPTRRCEFVAGAVGGVAIGLAVGWLIAEIRKRITTPSSSVTISLLSGYAAFIPAERSAPRACSPRSPPASTWASAARASSPRARGCRASWSGTSSTSCSTRRLFVLVGLQLRPWSTGSSGYSAGSSRATPSP